MKYTFVETRLGWVGLIGSEAGLCRVILPKPAEMVLGLLEKSAPHLVADASFFGDLPERIRRYFEGQIVSFPDRVDLAGVNAFRRAVYEVARSIPYGETRSYAWVAQQIGRPMAARAVGQAAASNPVCIIVPCHRVVGSDGRLRGYAGGLEMKRLLLEMERAASARGGEIGISV